MSHMPRRVSLRAAAALAILAAAATPLAAETDDDKLGIEQLLKSGWQVAGYTSTFDNRSALVLFRHPNETYLVQCLTGYDVTRSPRVYVNCYGLH
jgi:hypothetical protein